MKAINIKNLTHIEFFDVKEGIKGGYWWAHNMQYLPYKKGGLFSDKIKEGYYENGMVNSISGSFVSSDWVSENSHKVFVSGNKLYTYPRVELYNGKELISTKYFSNFDNMIQFVKQINFFELYENIKD